MDAHDGIDIGYMHAALRLAERGWGRAHPNPIVGAVVVFNREVVGQGYHREYGAAHAEIEALRDAGERARGATLYVTLEPCCHYGKTPPCTDAIVEAGIVRVVYGAGDPNPIAGGGAEVLRQAGIEVKGNVESEYVRTQNAAFFTLHEGARSFVALKLAMSLDARLTTSPNARQRVTGEAADREVHRLRSGFDAVMIGANTARVDNPLLTVRHGYQSIRPPLRVVIDTHAALRPDSRLVRSMDQAPLVVICSETADTDELLRAGVPIITVPTEAHGWVDVEQAFEQLAAAGVHSLLCEGGGTLGGSLLAAGLIDRIYVFIAPKIFGTAGTPAFPLENPLDSTSYQLKRIARYGEDALLMLDRCSPV